MILDEEIFDVTGENEEWPEDPLEGVGIKLFSKIDLVQDDEFFARKKFDDSISQLRAAWLDYKDNPDDDYCVSLKGAYATYMEYNKYDRLVEVKTIINGLFSLWKKDHEQKHLDLLLELFPVNDNQTYHFVLKFLRWPGKNAFRTVRALMGKCTNKRAVSRRIRKKINSLPFAPLKKLSKKGKKSWRKYWGRFVRLPLRWKGFSPYMSYEWLNMVKRSFKKEKNYTLRQKIWCYRRGFMPYRISQYGLTNNNYKEFLSDRDYCYLHPINNSFAKWINDKVSPRYVLAPFIEHQVKCYFHLLPRIGKIDIVPLIDCPEGYGPDYVGILKLLRDMGDLVLKRSSGTHGVGFRKLSYRDGVYFMNNSFCHECDIIKLFNSLRRFYVITEYITMHKDLKVIYPESVNTIRILVINENGVSPMIGDAFMRIGSSSTGVTDNVSFGGVFAKVDIPTGRYYDGEQVENHVITKCPAHPDTGIPIEGILPHWDMVLDKVKDICRFMPQLEYMGFDIAITDDGFKVLEINVHQDLHRYPLYRQEVKNYFMKKLEQKQKWYKWRYKRV